MLERHPLQHKINDCFHVDPICDSLGFSGIASDCGMEATQLLCVAGY